MAGIKISRSFQPRTPQYLPWVSGRFYDGLASITALTTTGIVNLQLHMYPIFVPHTILATSLGIETTVAAGAGSVARFAIYNNDPILTAPSTLIIDAGTVATDGATGAKAVVISQIVYPGINWLAVSLNNVAGNPTVRTFPSGSVILHSIYSFAYASFQNVLGGSALAANNAGMALVGFPRNMATQAVGDGLIWINSAVIRILIGV